MFKQLVTSLIFNFKKTCSSGAVPQGLKALGFLFFMIPFVTQASSVGNITTTKNLKELMTKLEDESQNDADFARQSLRFVKRDPFIPQKFDFGIDYGAGWRESSLYLVGLNTGYHLGTCIFTDSHTCQQYADVLGNLSGRESYTHYTGLASLRWQFISFPSSWSQTYRLFLGSRHSIVPKGLEDNFVYGLGMGLSTYLHPKADLRLELRAGLIGGQIFSEVVASIQLKLDRWVDYFENKLSGAASSGPLSVK
jgi:hypothetical protein